MDWRTTLLRKQTKKTNQMETSTNAATSGSFRTTCSGYVRHYKALHHQEEATTSLAWKDGVLMQKWKISETRDIYCDEAKTDYSHTENHLEIEWRAIPVIQTKKVMASPPLTPTDTDHE